MNYNNPYPGVNAHLNSLLQTPGTIEQPAMWPGFHNQHIANIVEALTLELPDNYTAYNEQSLQTREPGIVGLMFDEKLCPDVSVFQEGRTLTSPEGVMLVTPTWEASLEEVLDPVEEPFAVVIREVLDQQPWGRVVARIELLSPSNKPGGSNYAAYEAKRIKALESDVPLIEIDYLHESHSTLPKLPRYPENPQSYAYSIIVSDPRPNWHEGRVRVYSFNTCEPIKTFPLPLAGSEFHIFDLNPVYQHTFRSTRWRLNYASVPRRFDTYRADDQQRILALMRQINAET